MSENDWVQAVQRELGVQFGAMRQVSGGDFAQAWCVEVESSGVGSSAVEGSNLFVKTHANPPPNHFSTEARGLEWLKATESVAVPTVLATSDNPPFLALEWIHEGGRSAGSEGALGRQLAKMHKHPVNCFGREDRRTTGSLGLPNEPCSSWAEFYGTQRLQPLAKIASDRAALSQLTIERIEILSQRLNEFAELDTAASCLHGDLWAGNRLVDSDGRNWLIDPACHGGHREFDLAMMRLFGGYGEDCFNTYQDNYPLEAGWKERVPLHQLAPLIVHAIKFGRSYVSPTEEALSLYV